MIRIEGDGSEEVLSQVAVRNAPARHGPPVRSVVTVSTMAARGLGEAGGLVVTGDLQFRGVPSEPSGAGPLAGVVVAEELARLCRASALPPAQDLGVVLTGDLYCGPDLDRRGESGDVREVWEAFATHFGFVCGVAGNHDTFGSLSEEDAFCSPGGPILLDLATVEWAGVRIGGLGGIVGSPERRNRRSEDEYLAAVDLLVTDGELDMLVLHESPAVAPAGLPGNPRLASVLARSPRPLLTCCGHVHWDLALASLSERSQVLNADGRCVVLLAR